jgi:hypothetical protein
MPEFFAAIIHFRGAQFWFTVMAGQEREARLRTSVPAMLVLTGTEAARIVSATHGCPAFGRRKRTREW